MKKLNFILLVTLFLFITSECFSQLREELRNEVIAYIQKEAMDFPQNEKGELPFQSIYIASQELTDIFTNYKVLSVQKAFPDFLDKDSIKKNDKGEDVRLPFILQNL